MGQGEGSSLDRCREECQGECREDVVEVWGLAGNKREGEGGGREGVAASPLASAATSWGGRVALPPYPPACPFSPIHPLLSDVLALNTPALLPASPSNHTLCSLLFHFTPAARGGGLKRCEVWTGCGVSSGITNAGVQDFLRVLRSCAEARVLGLIIV